jgi:hypothetical protein
MRQTARVRGRNRYPEVAKAQLDLLREKCRVVTRLEVAHWVVTFVDPDNFGEEVLTSTVADEELVDFMQERIGGRTFNVCGTLVQNHARVLKVEAK